MIRINQVSFEQHWWPGYNNANLSERTVEIPLAGIFISEFGKDTLEVGCVTPYYFAGTQHTVIDLTDPHPQNVKLDAAKADYTNMDVLSISTLEHIGIGDYDLPVDESAAVKTLEKIFNEASTYLITIPIGHNRPLDKYVSELKQKIVLNRIDMANTWDVYEDKDPLSFKYNEPYPYANGLWLITNLSQFLFPTPQYDTIIAKYGSYGHFVDVTGKVSEWIAHNRKHRIDNSILGWDPCPNTTKVLIINRFTLEGTPHTYFFKENDIFSPDSIVSLT